MTTPQRAEADPRKRRTAMVIAYLCTPGRGSEGGAGWGMLRALERTADCTVITGMDSAAGIEAHLQRDRGMGLTVAVAAEPKWAAVAKRFRVGEFLTYLAWERNALRVGRELAGNGDVDVAVHVTLSAFWLPSVAPNLGLPSVWGPVGGAVTTPLRLVPLLGWRGAIVELVDWLAVRVMSLLPATRRTWRDSTVRIVQNDDTLDRLPRKLRPSTTVLNHALFHDVPLSDPEPDGADGDNESPYVAWVSPMESRKGPELAVRALAAMSSGIGLVMAGDGPERARIERIAQSLGVGDRITFVGRVPHDRALAIIRAATVVLFTGLREEGGLALAEAMLLGTPIVVLGNGGAKAIAESATDTARVSIVEPGSIRDTAEAMAAALDGQIAKGANRDVSQRSPLIDQHAALEDLERIVESAAATTARSGPEA